MYEVIHSDSAVIKIENALRRYREETGSEHLCDFT